MEEKLNLTQEWDKVFPQSDKVNHSKITFHNRYGITLAADLYMPKHATGKLPAIAVCGPFGAVKEQVSGLYAQTLAERGFLTLAFDRTQEFSPVKNAEGNDSPATTKRDLQAKWRGWLAQANVSLPENTPVEIDPAYALNAEQLKAKGLQIG